jgi:hypothetical protein
VEGDLRRLQRPAPAGPDRQPGLAGRALATFEDVRRIALGLPEAEEVLTWGTDITFRVRGKIFAIGGEGAEVVSIKASLEAQQDLLALDSGTFSKAAYTGRYGWVNVRLDGIGESHLRELLENAWRQTAPKRLTRG